MQLFHNDIYKDKLIPMSKPKICFFVPFYPLIKGGAEYQSKIIAKELASQGYDIFFVSGGHLKNKTTITDGFKVYQLSIDNSLKERLVLYKNFMKGVHNIILKEKPGFVYQRILNTFTYYLASFTKEHNIPFILHIADNYSLQFSNSLNSILKRYLFKKILASQPYIICQTDYQQLKIRELDYEPSVKIPNMHPKIADHKVERNLNCLVWIGNAREVKQLELYLDLAQHMKNSDFQFHVIGAIPKNVYGEELNAIIKSCENVIYHGSKDNAFINSFLQTAAILINTSVSEGFSNTFIQAWMCGTPVIALNSDPDGLLTSNNLGIDCNGNFNLMKEAIVSISGKKQYQTQSNKIRDTAIALFSTSVNIRKFTHLIEKVERINVKVKL